MRSIRSGDCSDLLMSALSLFTMSRGVALGTMMPATLCTLNPGMVSATVGISAKPAARLGLVIAIALTLPDLMFDSGGAGGEHRKHAPAHFHTDSAVTDKAAGRVEHRFPADPKILVGAIGIDPAEGEIKERTPG